MSEQPDQARGLYPKYQVIKLNGKPIGTYFVLEEHDPHAVAALRAYVESCAAEFPSLMADQWEQS